MKQYIYTLFMGALAAVATASCTQTDDEAMQGDGRAIRFSPEAETRAAVGSDKKGMKDFLVWGGYTTPLLFDGETVHPDGSYDGGTRYWVPGTWNFYAIHPASLSDRVNYGNGVFTVNGFDASATGTDAVDLMTAASGEIPYKEGDTPPTVGLKFQHELARVKVSLVANGATVDDLCIYGVGYKGNFTSNAVPKWELTTVATAENTPFSKQNLGQDGEVFDILLPTDTDLSDAKLKVSYHYGSEAPSSRSDETGLAVKGGWMAGKQYHYNASIASGTLNIKVTVVEWTEQDTSVNWD